MLCRTISSGWAITFFLRAISKINDFPFSVVYLKLAGTKFMFVKGRNLNGNIVLFKSRVVDFSFVFLNVKFWYENKRRNCSKLAAALHRQGVGGVWKVYFAHQF